jgi:hypothetical protein
MSLIFWCVEMTDEKVSHEDSVKRKVETAKANSTWQIPKH